MNSIASQFHSGCSLSHFHLEYIHYKIWNQSNSNQYLISKWIRFFSKAVIWRVQKCYISPKTSNWKRGSKLSLWLPTVAFHETATPEIAFPGTVLYLATGNPTSASVGTGSGRRILHTPLEPLAAQGQPGGSKWHQMDQRIKKHVQVNSYLPPPCTIFHPLSSYTSIATKAGLWYMKFLFLSYFWVFPLNPSTASLQICEKLLHLLQFSYHSHHCNLIYIRFCLGATHKYIRNFNLHFSPQWKYKNVILIFYFESIKHHLDATTSKSIYVSSLFHNCCLESLQQRSFLLVHLQDVLCVVLPVQNSTRVHTQLEHRDKEVFLLCQLQPSKETEHPANLTNLNQKKHPDSEQGK